MENNKSFVLQYFELQLDGFRDWVDFMEDESESMIEIWKNKAPNAQKNWRIIEKIDKVIVSG